MIKVECSEARSDWVYIEDEMDYSYLHLSRDKAIQLRDKLTQYLKGEEDNGSSRR